jgi:hypothetical protein
MMEPGIITWSNTGLYRASAAGGAFNVKVIGIDELIDQFAFGIKKHPLRSVILSVWQASNLART